MNGEYEESCPDESVDVPRHSLQCASTFPSILLPLEWLSYEQLNEHFHGFVVPKLYGRFQYVENEVVCPNARIACATFRPPLLHKYLIFFLCESQDFMLSLDCFFCSDFWEKS